MIILVPKSFFGVNLFLGGSQNQYWGQTIDFLTSQNQFLGPKIDFWTAKINVWVQQLNFES